MRDTAAQRVKRCPYEAGQGPIFGIEDLGEITITFTITIKSTIVITNTNAPKRPIPTIPMRPRRRIVRAAQAEPESGPKSELLSTHKYTPPSYPP